MKVKFERSFLKDIRKISDPNIKSKVAEIIDSFKISDSIIEIPNIIKLKSDNSAFRVRI